ncbi:MAG: TetR/AcrR family transcriptional regulator [Endozoicomonas sp.]
MQTLGRRERKKQAVRERIHEETIRLIEQVGIDSVTIDLVCEQADIARKTFYNYYSSRQELLIEICQSRLLFHTEMVINAAMAESNSLEEQLTLVFSWFKNNFATANQLQRDLIVFMISNFSTNRSQTEGQLLFMNNCFLKLYEQHNDRLLAGLSPQFCAEITVGLINGISMNWLSDQNYDITGRMDQIVEYLMGSLVKDT